MAAEPDPNGKGSPLAHPGRSRSVLRSPHRLGTLLALLLLLASLANGTPFLLARIGVIAPEAYQRDRQTFCPPAGPPLGMVSACSAYRPDPEASVPARVAPQKRLPFERLHADTEPWRPWKLSRLLLLLGLPLTALLSQGAGCLPGWRRLGPALPLLLSSALAVGISVVQRVPAPALLASLLSLLWLAPLLLAAPFTSRGRLAHWARAAAWLLWLQLPLLLLEAWRGLPLPFGPTPVGVSAEHGASHPALLLPTRLVGSFIHPNSLGAAAVILLGFALSFRQAPVRKGAFAGGALGLWLAALTCVLLARSATGLLAWLVLLAWFAGHNRLSSAQNRSQALRQTPSRRWALPSRRAAWATGLALAATLLLLSAMPRLLGRPDLWRSPLGRWQALADGMAAAGPLQWLFGQGMAANSNQLLSLLGPQAAIHPASSDGMPVLLLLQSGLFGLMAFYGLLLWAWRRDQTARPFLLCAAIASLTLNITELFPVNLLLGLTLAGLLRSCPLLSEPLPTPLSPICFSDEILSASSEPGGSSVP